MNRQSDLRLENEQSVLSVQGAERAMGWNRRVEATRNVGAAFHDMVAGSFQIPTRFMRGVMHGQQLERSAQPVQQQLQDVSNRIASLFGGIGRPADVARQSSPIRQRVAQGQIASGSTTAAAREQRDRSVSQESGTGRKLEWTQDAFELLMNDRNERKKFR